MTRLGLVLGGGGVRGFAHVGVLNTLTGAGVLPDVLVGVSMGALVGATYAAREDWLEVLDRAGRERLPSFVEAEREGVALARMRTLVRSARMLAPTVWTWGRQGYEEYGRSTLQALLGDVETFEDLRVPLAVVSTDLTEGERVVLDAGRLVPAVLASGAIPGLARPVVYEGRTLIDGGFADPAPVDVARTLGADVVIAVHVGQYQTTQDAENWAMALLRGLEIGQRKFADERLAHADLVLRPDFGERVHVLNVGAVMDVVRCGDVCAKENLDAVKALLEL